jgi:hypothetical protein
MTYTHSDRPWERPRQTRGGGAWSVYLLGEEIRVRTITEALSAVLLKLESTKPGFLDKLSERRTRTGRRIVAQNPEDIHPNRPDLTEKYAYALNSEWYYNGNIDSKRCQRFLEIIASVAGIETPWLVERS